MIATDFALRHRTTVFVLIFLIVVIGMISYLIIPREAAPDIKIPTIMVIIPYPGVSPEDVESLVTNRLEAECEDLRDLDEMKSTSAEGMSAVYLTFLPDTDIAEATQRVRDRVNRARAKLPNDIQEPVVNEISSSDWPILMVNISGDAGLVRLKRIAEDVAQDIEAIEGVLEAKISGGLEREIRVEVNPHALRASERSLTDVVNAMGMENINIPGGPVEEGDVRYTLRVPEEITDPDQLKDLVVSTKFDHPLKVREIATVVDGFKEQSTASRYRGREGVSISVTKQSGANIIKVVSAVKKLVTEQSESFPPGTQVVYLNDQGKFVGDMVHELENNILTALVLVMAVLFMFIGGRNATFVALAVPLSMLVSFLVLSALDVTMNMVVLFSLILALGMLVDNAIVIVENIYRHSRFEETLLDAALTGTKEVGWPVITSTLTTVSVFVPLLFWPGIMGEFMGYLPLTLIITLCSSLFVALILNPVIASAFMKREKGSKEEEEKPPEGRFVRGYRWMLEKSLNWGILVVLAVVLLLIGSVMIYAGSKPEVEFFPSTTPEQARLSIRAPEGTKLEATDKISRQLETFLEAETNIKYYLADVGVGGGGGHMVSSGEGTPYLGRISMDFHEMADWTENPFQTIEDLRALTTTVAGAEIRMEKQKRGPPTGAPVNIEIAGLDFKNLSAVADQVKDKIKDIEGLTDLRDDFSEGRPELLLRFDRALSNRLILHGLRVVAGTVRTAIYGTKATVYRLGDEEFDVTVRLQERFRNNREDVLSLTVAGKEGRQIPLSQVVKMTGDVGATSIRHVDRKRVITVSADTEGRSGAEVLKDARERLKDFSPRGAVLSYTGENKEMVKAQAFLGKALLVGVFFIALVLLTQFNNIAQAFIILFSVIMSMIGVLWGLIINDMPFCVIMTGVGIISLAGVVVNNAIVLIDFINKLRDRGRPLREAVIEGGVVRLRPVLLTAGTTILGLVPMAQGFDFDFRELHFATGTGSMEFWGPMAISVIYGLAFATVLTLVIVPVMYYLMERGKERLGRVLERYVWLKRILLTIGIILAILMAYVLITGLSAMNG